MVNNFIANGSFKEKQVYRDAMFKSGALRKFAEIRGDIYYATTYEMAVNDQFKTLIATRV